MGRKEPKVGCIYDAYFDGKCSPSRLYRVKVDRVIRRADMTRKMQRAWRAALREDFNSVFDGIVFYLNDAGELSRGQFWDSQESRRRAIFGEKKKVNCWNT